jgi:hypothetical protein
MGIIIGPDIPVPVGRKGSVTAEAGKGRVERRPAAEDSHAGRGQPAKTDEAHDAEKRLADIRVSPDAASLSRAPSGVDRGDDSDPEVAMDAAERSRNLMSAHPREARMAQALRTSRSAAETLL